MFRVGVKFCGNCNPRISGRALLDQVKANMTETLWLQADNPKKDALLIISGCPVDCATRPDWKGPTVVTAGETVNSISCALDDLPLMVQKKLNTIRDIFLIEAKKGDAIKTENR